MLNEGTRLGGRSSADGMTIGVLAGGGFRGSGPENGVLGVSSGGKM